VLAHLGLESGEFLGVATGRDDLSGWCAASHQLFDDEAPELAGGSGDDDGHGGAFSGGRQLVVGW
jgi:hypothetical protein